jgi:flagellar hook-associated protein 2
LEFFVDVNSNIINSLGAGSGINSASIVEQLVDIERTSKQTPIDNKRELIEAQVSDYGLLRSALSLLQDSAGILGKESTFSSKSASFTDSAALIPSVLDYDAPVGDYTFDVQAIATAQSLSTNATFTDANELWGKAC